MHTIEQQLMEELLTQPLSRTVDATSRILKRLYIFERGCMRAIAGWLPTIEAQEIKLLLARHLWMTAQSADHLRERILQLRYPRRDVDRGWDELILQVLESATNAPNEFCFITGIYDVINRSILETSCFIKMQSERVGDQPTILLIDEIRRTKQLQLDEMIPLLKTASFRACNNEDQRNRWQSYLKTNLTAAGNVNGMGELKEFYNDSSLEKTFSRPNQAKRDSRYERRCELMCHFPMFWLPKDQNLEWLSYAVGHLNELWAAEATAELIYNHSEAPWPLLLDAARWCYDEARHCQMGITRLERVGLNLFVDVPAPDAITYDIFEPDHLKERLLAIHCFERGATVDGTKQNTMKWHDQWGDEEGAHHYDFDWADESMHLRYGLDWLKHLYGEEILNNEFDQRLNEAIDLRHEYLKKIVTKEKALVEINFRHLCEKLKIPFQIQSSINYKGRE